MQVNYNPTHLNGGVQVLWVMQVNSNSTRFTYLIFNKKKKKTVRIAMGPNLIQPNSLGHSQCTSLKTQKWKLDWNASVVKPEHLRPHLLLILPRASNRLIGPCK